MTKLRKKITTAIRNIRPSTQEALKRAIKFGKSAFVELRLVTWPSRSDTIRYSIYIFAFIIGGSLLIAGLDIAFFELLKLITN